jgi:hypothetical protein
VSLGVLMDVSDCLFFSGLMLGIDQAQDFFA